LRAAALRMSAARRSASSSNRVNSSSE
jgi:hypothetical protein